MIRILLLILFVICFSCTQESTQQVMPNVILIIADDLGWGDVGFHGSEIQTPNIDLLAKEGIQLDRFYVAPICSPTRAGLLTGRYPNRYGLRNNVIRPWLDFGLDTTEVTLPEVLAEAGYANRALVGKWHLGHSRRSYHPLNRGYTYFYGHLNGAIDYFNFKREGERDWHENYQPSLDSGYTTDLIGKKACQLVRKYAAEEGPFFLQIAFNAPHSPLQATRKYLNMYGFDPEQKGFVRGRGRGNTKRQTYSAMVTHMDHEIGKLLQLMDSLKMADNTVVLFMSDNGAELNHGGFNGELRGGKLTEWEGGVRVPAILKWPDRIKKGGKTDQVMGYIDVLPTLLSMIEFQNISDLSLDGMDMSIGILEARNAVDRTFYLGNGAAISRQHKLIEGGEKVGLTRMKLTEDHLFNITTDETEVINLVMDDSLIYKRMKNIVKEYNEIPSSVPIPDDARPPSFTAPSNWTIQPMPEQTGG